MTRTSDRNLLFGILALQMDFISRQALIEGMQAWLLDKQKTLGHLLVDRGALSQQNHDLLEPLVEAHIQQHGDDARESLAALSSDNGMAMELAHMEDEDLQASLTLLPEQVPQAAGSPSSAETGLDDVPGEPATFAENGDDFGEPTIQEPEQPQLRFRILRPHAEGGLGRVHVALDRELNREVAFKEIKPQHARAKDAQTRFMVEAEVTGGLEHPGIVPVYGLGHFGDGRPFYAMRFIRGQSLHDAIAEFYQQESLDRNSFSSVEFRALIHRLIDVCNAIEYAHSRKVLHRDLKPGNIMLGRYGETLVVDWGLAKPAGMAEPTERSADGDLPIVPSSGSQSEPTADGRVLGTPSYMPPEQASGKLDQIGRASDVYSLGATLYEILTGHSPLKGQALPDLLRNVIKGDIPSPREENPQAPLALDAICTKAMAVDPADRYSTAKALADDLEACLADEPVAAFPETAMQKASRWARRNQSWVRAITAGLLLVLVTSMVALYFVNKARHEKEVLAEQNFERFDQTRGLAVKLIGTIESEVANLRGSLQARQLIVREGLGVLTTLSTDVGEDPQLRLDLSQAYITSGDLLGNDNNANIGDTDGAIDSYRKALAHAQAVPEELVDGAELQRRLSMIHDRLGFVLMQKGEIEEALKHLSESLTLSRAAADDNAQRQIGLWQAINRTGDIYYRIGRVTDALAHYEEALVIIEKLHEENPENDEITRLLAVNCSLAGRAHQSLQNDLKALEYCSRSLALHQQRAENAPENSTTLRDLAYSLSSISRVQRETELTRFIARANVERAIGILKDILDNEPENVQVQHDLALAMENLGVVAQLQDDHETAVSSFTSGLEQYQQLLKNDPDNAFRKSGVSTALNKLGEVQEEAKLFEEALKSYTESLNINLDLLETDPTNAKQRRAVAIRRQNIGMVNEALGNWTAALENYQESLSMRRGLVAEQPGDPRLQSDLNYSLGLVTWLLATCPDEAIHDHEEAIRLGTELCEETGFEDSGHIAKLAAAYAASGDFEAAVKWQKQVVDADEDDETSLAHLKLYENGQPFRQDTIDK